VSTRAERVYVWTDAFGPSRLVGQALVLASQAPGKYPGQFTYSEAYATSPTGFSIDPLHLPRSRLEHSYVTHSGLPAALLDAGPDDWGRRVLGELKRPPETEIEFLLAGRGLGVGCLQFSLSRDSVKAREAVLQFDDLAGALAAVGEVERNRPLSENALLLLAAGATLGGARPKVSVEHRGHTWIAKFPSNKDAVDQPLVEYASLRLAREKCGIDAADVDIVTVEGRSVLLVRRFDFDNGARIHYLSMFAGIVNGEPVREERSKFDISYPGIAEFLKRHGADFRAGAEEVFRRACFNLMLGHVDDHVRNHGFLLDGPNDVGWRLAPAFDLAPSNGEALALRKQPSVQSIGLGADGRVRSLENLFGAVGRYRISKERAREIYAETLTGVRTWASFFEACGVTGNDIDRMRHRVLADGIHWERF
jgi:serine/threonine-protein kinase HipA